MKKHLLYILLPGLLIFLQSPVTAQISVVGFVQTTGAGDQYPTHMDSLQKGGYRVVKDYTERDAITDLRRKEGMLVYEQNSDSTYILKGGITNTNWVSYTPGGSINGTANYISKYGTATTLSNSLVFDNGTNIGIGTTTPAVKLDVNGPGRFTGTNPLTLIGLQPGAINPTDSVLTVNGGLVKTLAVSSFTAAGNWVPYVASPPVSFGNAYSHIMANPDNMAGGGIAVSDDGGFYDYNDSYITFKGIGLGLRVNGGFNVLKTDNSSTSIASFALNNLSQQTEISANGISMGGTNANVHMYLQAKGTGSIILWNPVLAAYNATFLGNVGVGTSASGIPLNLANVLGDKIALWGNSGNTYGFGIQNNLLQIHTDAAASDIAFGYGSSAAFTERMRITGTGNLTVTGNLTSAGSGTFVNVTGTGNANFVNVNGTGNGSFDKVYATNNGNGTNFYVGDDIVLGDVNITDGMSLRGQVNAARAYVVFGNANNIALGRSGTGPLEYGGEVFFGGTLGTGTNKTGNGVRMMWIPDKGAFRAGEAAGFKWEGASVGTYSAAFGSNTFAGGWGSIAAGTNNTALGAGGAAFGNNNYASGDYATIFGNGNTASGVGSVAGGVSNQATNTGSVVFGSSCIASGVSSFALGTSCVASGNYSVALGRNCTASASGSFFMNDGTLSLTNSTPNSIYMVFSGGYRFRTDVSGGGVMLATSQNAWSSISDRNKKENFQTADGEYFLRSISTMPLGSWNYKMQDPAMFRHYGPMAQDIFAAFGKDKYGISGNDTTINSADMAGISFIAIQALEKRTTQLTDHIKKLTGENDKTKADNIILKNENEQLLNRLNDMQGKIDKLYKAVEEKLKPVKKSTE